MEKLKMDSENFNQLCEIFKTEMENFYGGNFSAGTRARKALSEISKSCKVIRNEIQGVKNAGRTE